MTLPAVYLIDVSLSYRRSLPPPLTALSRYSVSEGGPSFSSP